MNILNCRSLASEASRRAEIGTLPALSGSMFGDTLPFRLQLASSTAKFAPGDGAAPPTDAPRLTLPGMEAAQLPVRSAPVAVSGLRGGAEPEAALDSDETEELAPTLALLAPIPEPVAAKTMPAPGVVEAPLRGSTGAIAVPPGAMSGDISGEDRMPSAPDNSAAGDEVLSDPEGELAALLRRARAPSDNRHTVTAKTAPIGEAAPAESDDPAPAPISPRLDQALPPAPRGTEAGAEPARALPTAQNPRIRAAAPDAELPVDAAEAAAEAVDPARDQRTVAAPPPMPMPMPFSDARASRPAASFKPGDSLAASRLRDPGSYAEAPQNEFSFVEYTDLPRQTTAPVADPRPGQPAPFVGQLVPTGIRADQPLIDGDPRTDTAQTLPLDQRFGERLGAMVGAAMGNAVLKDGMLRLQVSPDHLGPIEIEMDTSGNSERLQITVESEAVRQAVAQAHGRIEQELRQAGARLAGIDIALRDSGADAQSQSQGQANAQGNGQTGTDGRRPGSAATSEAALPGADSDNSFDDRTAPRGAQAGNILYA